MARIDFHSNVADKLEYACRLTRKIWSATPAGVTAKNIEVSIDRCSLAEKDLRYREAISLMKQISSRR